MGFVGKHNKHYHTTVSYKEFMVALGDKMGVIKDKRIRLEVFVELMRLNLAKPVHA